MNSTFACGAAKTFTSGYTSMTARASRRPAAAPSIASRGRSPGSVRRPRCSTAARGTGARPECSPATIAARSTASISAAVQNERNRTLTKQAGLSDKIRVFDGAFEALPFDDNTYDAVWSQDAFLHSGDKARVFREVARVLKPGGALVFTDPMQADDCPPGVLNDVLARIHLDSLGSFSLYRTLATEVGMREVEVIDLTPQLSHHYASVHRELSGRRSALEQFVSPAYIDRMLQGLQHWVNAGQAGHLAWGILHFEN